MVKILRGPLFYPPSIYINRWDVIMKNQQKTYESYLTGFSETICKAPKLLG
jgi:hypothetical protein